MPNKINIRKLVNALRSGNYKQTQRALARKNRETGEISYCCLGVACEIYLQEVKKQHWIFEDSLMDNNLIARGLSQVDGLYAGYLDSQVIEWYGFESQNPILIEDKTSASITNDVLDYDFNKIADLFEKKYLSDET